MPQKAEMVQILYTFDEGYVKDEILLPVDDGYLTLDMGKTSAAILRYRGGLVREGY